MYGRGRRIIFSSLKGGTLDRTLMKNRKYHYREGRKLGSNQHAEERLKKVQELLEPAMEKKKSANAPSSVGEPIYTIIVMGVYGIGERTPG